MIPPGASFNPPWLIGGNFVPLLDKFFPAEWSAGQRKLVVHVDNVPVHRSRMTQDSFERNPLKRRPHPPYFPDVSPSDFYVFGKATSALVGQSIPDEVGLFEAVAEVLNGLSGAESQNAFRSWIERIEQVSDAGEDYLP
jgi:hypothetical protein